MNELGHIKLVERRSQQSLEASQARRREKQATREKRQGLKFLRKHLGASVVGLCLIPAAAGYAALAKDGPTKIDKQVMVYPGDTLSEIAEDQLETQGDRDPSTQEIKDEMQKIAHHNPDDISPGGTALEGHVLEIPAPK